MRVKTFAMVSTALFVGTLLLKGPTLSAETDQGRMVRLAELEIDPAYLEPYKVAAWICTISAASPIGME
jgi:hypothetical protein